MDQKLKIILIAICFILFIVTTIINIKLKKSALNQETDKKKNSLYLSLLIAIIITLTVITIIILKAK